MEDQSAVVDQAEKMIPLSAVAPLMDLLSNMIEHDPEPSSELLFRYDDAAKATGHKPARWLVLKHRA